MSRRCDLTDKGPATGNRVSHSNHKTRRRFLPNLQPATFRSEALNRVFRMRVATSALRTVTKHGGLDAFLMSQSEANLSAEAVRLRRSVLKVLSNAKPAKNAEATA
ncbi:MAG: large subunit ribosomal protein L28 [Hyphomicrobiaceae bacterium]|jgi:large subunit ribosomal protein L28